MENYFPLHFTQKNEIKRGLTSADSKFIDRMECWIKDPRKIPERSEEHILTIVWDLDQTLVSADGVDDENPDDPDVRLVLRPHAEKILIALRKNQDVEFIVWTAGTESHAKRVVKSFDNVHFDYIISRNETWYDEYIQIKNLKYLNRDLNSVVLIDDRMDVGKKHPENLLVVAPYYPKEKNLSDDTTLLYLANILQKAINDYRSNQEEKKNFSSFLYSPLTEKCVYNGMYYYGVKSFETEEELQNRILSFRLL